MGWYESSLCADCSIPFLLVILCSCGCWVVIVHVWTCPLSLCAKSAYSEAESTAQRARSFQTLILDKSVVAALDSLWLLGKSLTLNAAYLPGSKDSDSFLSAVMAGMGFVAFLVLMHRAGFIIFLIPLYYLSFERDCPLLFAYYVLIGFCNLKLH